MFLFCILLLKEVKIFDNYNCKILLVVSYIGILEILKYLKKGVFKINEV